MNGTVSVSRITFPCCVWHFVCWQTTPCDCFSRIFFRFRGTLSWRGGISLGVSPPAQGGGLRRAIETHRLSLNKPRHKWFTNPGSEDGCHSRHLMAVSATLLDSRITSETEFSAQGRFLADGSNVGATQSELLELIKSVGRFCTFGQVMPDFCTLGQDMLC